MRAMFNSNFAHVSIADAIEISTLISTGKIRYINYTRLQRKLKALDEGYRSIPVLYKELGVSTFVPESKRRIYSEYNSGVVAGAGSGDDCIDLIGVKSWKLYDLEDTRMINKVIGHSCGTAKVSILGTPDGSTVSAVNDKYVKDTVDFDVVTIDSLELNECGIIAADVEGSGLDVLAGAMQTLIRLKPDVLMSIYHTWEEYLLVIPFLHELGYCIDIIRTSSACPTQPHLELTVRARHDSNCS